jgi:hypothetical protein
MIDEADLRRIQRLVEELESDDAFERRDAIEHLAAMTRQRLGFEWGAPEADRGRAVRRWRKWLTAEREKRKGQEVHATIQMLTQGQVDPAALQKLLKSLPPEQKKALLAQLVIAKAAAEAPQGVTHAACERCSQRPATVRITSLQEDGTYLQQGLCEVCVAQEKP